ncbi:hypothetical protein MACK_002392 [Theileria orientalis]|uniref:Uncharacterized protein n=1 Tax=Theileria orientalis TaxID=68886 RepID=A0A976QUZ4_THEOR|nr:hypothetical protein MACK_002392 [Theileria orientalis]
MDIFYAKDGFLINEIYLSGNKRWPPDGEVKQCKKVLFIINPSDGKKTLRVLYPDEDEAYDPDNPPQKTSDPNQGMTQPSQGGTTTPLLSESTASYNEADVSSLYSPLASVSGSTETIPSLEDVLSATDPNAITSVPHQDSYKTDGNGQVYLEFTVAKGQESSDLASGSHGTDAFIVEEIHPPNHGRTIEYEDSDDEFTPDDDDTPVDLTTYVTRVGRRVGQLETRMDSAETTIRLLTRTLGYQHEILDFRRRFGVKTAPFGADMGRHAFFDPAAFRPATSQVSKVLDPTEHPSDIKLFVLDVNDDSKHAELGKDKFTVKQEGDEIQYVFEPGVECKLVTFKDRTVWNHRSTDPHPNGVVFHPVDDKVVVDFEDAIVMFVKKGELDGDDVSSGHPAKKSIVDIPLDKIESDDDLGHHKAGERENGTDVAANATSNGGDIVCYLNLPRLHLYLRNLPRLQLYQSHLLKLHLYRQILTRLQLYQSHLL